MKITVNGKELLLENSLSIKNLINHLNIDADIFIVNSFPVSLSYIINNNDTVTLIKKGSIPDKEYLEYQLICRQDIYMTDTENTLKSNKLYENNN